MGRMARIVGGALAALLLAMPVCAEAADDGGRTEALAGALAGSDEGILELERYLDDGGEVEETARRAASLIRELRRPGLASDPIVLQQAADQIASAASRSFISARIFRLQVTKAFSLGEGRFGFDFAPPDAEVAPGFVKVTARSEFIKRGRPSAMRRPDAPTVLRDGIRNVRELWLPVPPGRYRAFLLTDDIGVAEAVTSPFGAALKVNGKRVRVVAAAPESWIADTYLDEVRATFGKEGEALAAAVESRGGALGQGSGGVLVMSVEVGAEGLALAFDVPEGLETYFTGIILEPEGPTSILALTRRARRILLVSPEQILAAEAVVNAALAELLSAIATAAGPDELSQLIDAPDPVVEPANDVSPN